MIRLVFLILLALAAATGFSWLADRPGQLMLNWMGYRIELSMLTASVALLILIIALMLIWQMLRMVLHGPQAMTHFFRARRKAKGFEAVARGLVAVSAGDPRLALKSASDAESLLGEAPMTLLLRSQAAQLSGDSEAAGQAFKRMLSNEQTRALGLRGLYVEAQRANDSVSARRYAEEASKIQPLLPWAGKAVLENQAILGEWENVLQTLRRLVSAHLLDKPQAKRLRAVALTAQALAVEQNNAQHAESLAREAHQLAPDLVPACTLAASKAIAAHETKKACKMLERTWKSAPHPDLAELYTHSRQGDSALDRLEKAKTLAGLRPDHEEGTLSIARTALEARAFDVARDALAPLLEAPTQRVCVLQAALAEAEGDIGGMRQWLSRSLSASKDPVWIADGVISDHWQPLSPISKKLDGFVWTTPPYSLSGAVLSGLAQPIIPPPIELELIPPPPETSPVHVQETSEPLALPLQSPDLVPLHAPDDPGITLEDDEPPKKRFFGLFGG